MPNMDSTLSLTALCATESAAESSILLCHTQNLKNNSMALFTGNPLRSVAMLSKIMTKFSKCVYWFKLRQKWAGKWRRMYPSVKLTWICLTRPAQVTLASAKSLKIDGKIQVGKKKISWTTGRLEFATWICDLNTKTIVIMP